jgi:ATP-dependent DNA helicase RecG
MKKETQNVEWKENWRDEYLKWVSGFANAQGGKLYIGMDDNGKISGLQDTRKLLEDIPNKTKDILGILVDVNLHKQGDKEYLEIIVEPYPYPISYKGQYFYRSGSTKQELKGAALDKFLLQKQGLRWDSVPIYGVPTKGLDASAFSYFREHATRSKRLANDLLNENNRNLLDKLHLLNGKHLKRAAILLFHPDPERFVTGAFIKLGFFESDDHLVFQDIIHGNLFVQVERTIELLLTKYLRATIRYAGISRVEEYPYPEGALREALLNAVAHKDYSLGHSIQISVYEDKIVFWNEGALPDNWTAKRLSMKHASRPFNPDIASTFFLAGLIESWGRGTLRIISECKRIGLPAPVFYAEGSDISVQLNSSKSETVEKPVEKTVEKTVENAADHILALIGLEPQITISKLAKITGLSRRGVEYNLKKLKTEGKIDRIGPDKGGNWKINTLSKQTT